MTIAVPLSHRPSRLFVGEARRLQVPAHHIKIMTLLVWRLQDVCRCQHILQLTNRDFQTPFFTCRALMRYCVAKGAAGMETLTTLASQPYVGQHLNCLESTQPQAQNWPPLLVKAVLRT